MINRQKLFGQNFLSDPQAADRIVSEVLALAGEASPENRTIVEIGPGKGAITIPLARAASEKGFRVIAIEKDRHLVPKLQEILESNEDKAGETATGVAAKGTPAQVTVVEKDFLELGPSDLETLLAPDKRAVFAGNLPYSVASRILVELCLNSRFVSGAVLMFQKEVAERILAGPSTKEYGVLSVAVQSRFRPAKIINLPPSAFKPAPTIWSTVLNFTPLETPVISEADYPEFLKTVKKAFSMRRKTLRNCLPHLTPEQWTSSGIDPGRRSETLSIEEFSRLHQNSRH